MFEGECSTNLPVSASIGLSDNTLGTVGREVASDARDPRIESSHRQFNLLPFDCFINCIENMKMKKKEAGNSPFSTTANLQSIGTI